MSVNTSAIQGWLDRFNEGDAEAKRELLTHTRDRLMRIAHRMLHGRSDQAEQFMQTDDVVQELYARVLTKLDKFFESTTKGTVCTVAQYFAHARVEMRTALNELLRQQKGRSGKRPTPISLDEAGDSPRKQSEPPSGITELERIRTMSRFLEAIDELDEKLRTVVDLHHFQEFTHSETAEVMGISSKTVEKYWLMARVQLQAKMAGGSPA